MASGPTFFQTGQAVRGEQSIGEDFVAVFNPIGGGAWEFLRFPQDKLTCTSLYCLSFPGRREGAHTGFEV